MLEEHPQLEIMTPFLADAKIEVNTGGGVCYFHTQGCTCMCTCPLEESHDLFYELDSTHSSSSLTLIYLSFHP